MRSIQVWPQHFMYWRIRLGTWSSNSWVEGYLENNLWHSGIYVITSCSSSPSVYKEEWVFCQASREWLSDTWVILRQPDAVASHKTLLLKVPIIEVKNLCRLCRADHMPCRSQYCTWCRTLLCSWRILYTRGLQLKLNKVQLLKIPSKKGPNTS